MKKLSFGLAMAATLTACASAVLAPGAEDVKITTNPAEVQGCKALGSVKAEPPFNQAHDDQKTLINEALILGGNVVLLTHKGSVAAALFLPPDAARAANVRRGVAYACDNSTYAKVKPNAPPPPRSPKP